MPRPLPSAVSRFDAGKEAKDTVKYPHLPRSPPVKALHTTYPSLAKTGRPAPKTKLPMGYTCPIMTNAGAHPADTGSILPAIGNA
jgi:hypothetical protein